MTFCHLCKQENALGRGTNEEKCSLKIKSKETYGQTRGLSNLEMKHIGELPITGVLSNAVKTSRVCTMQGRT